MELAPIFDEFLAYLDLECARSRGTLVAYSSDFRQFLECLAETGRAERVDAVDRQAIRQYITWLRRRGLSVTSVCRRLPSLRSLWRLVRDNGYTERDPFVRVSMPKRPKSLPVCLSAQEAESLFCAAGEQPSAEKAFRDVAILSVLLFTGLRRSELLGLRLSHVDLAEGTLRVERGKGSKSRLLPLAARPLEALRDWLELRPACTHDFLFSSIARRPLGVKGLASILRRALVRAAIHRPRLTLHSLRHSCATRLLQSGCDLHSVQRLLGHARLDSTVGYLSLTMHDLHRAVARHPLATA